MKVFKLNIQVKEQLPPNTAYLVSPPVFDEEGNIIPKHVVKIVNIEEIYDEGEGEGG